MNYIEINTAILNDINDLGWFGGQPEDGIFVTKAIIQGGDKVPEPGTLLLLGSGLLSMILYRRKTGTAA